MDPWLRQNLHTKYEISELLIKMCKCSSLTAIASGYAGRDPQGGFAMEAFKVLYWNLYEENESSSLFKELKMKTSYVKVRKKTVEWEGGENQKTKKEIMYKWLFTRKWKGVMLVI